MLVEKFYKISKSQLSKPSKFIIDLIKNHKKHIFLLTGELGAGKTTFISNTLKLIDKDFFVQSPSYNLVNKYQNSQFSFLHFDLYRIKDQAEIENLGFYEYWQQKNCCFVEWWKNAESYFNNISNKVEITIETLDDNNRNFTMEYE